MLPQLVGELLRVTLPEPEPGEKILRHLLVGQLDPDSPVVVGHAGEPTFARLSSQGRTGAWHRYVLREPACSAALPSSARNSSRLRTRAWHRYVSR